MNMKKFVAMLLGVMMVFSTATVSANSTDKELLPSNVPFCDVINYAADIEDVNEIKHGVIVNNTDKKCADIEYDDLKKWLDVYYNFNYYDRVVAPLGAFDVSGNYVKLRNEDKSKSIIVYSNGGVIAGKFGKAYESHGETKQNYVWYLPAIGNSRNALNIADMSLDNTYLTRNDDVEYKGYMQREFTSNDGIELPTRDYLISDSANQWAIPEIEKAAACNLMIYELCDKYSEPITRYEFCKLAYRLIATEFSPNSDSRMGVGLVMQDVLDERGISDVGVGKFSDCDFSEVAALTSIGIINGMGDGTFCPDSCITREQAAAILCRTAEFLGNKTIIRPQYEKMFDDENCISDWAKSSVASMKAMGIMEGISEKEFAPAQTYTVEQAIATMVRLYECG